ncbi:hypothetical protein BHE90_017040 [Fusarium euwallaceae]|uniref:Protein kinase domain-containing protein n=2 Tax=Fusarium solani species complex TaxID=232080 RepID=A0A430KYP4_9HYPO|nr:hypothetical protein CEP51_011155 [Fusarium floridanum]RTE68581.1 hypothetical protein BHE90_017040 [Fusarium euwallaceae]
MRWKNFCKPLLRQFPKHYVPIKWHGCVGCGVEGGVFKVSFGDDGPYALKLFWNTRPQEPLNRGKPFVFPFQDEARHVAIIEKIRWAVQHSENPIMVHPSPKSSELKLENLYCFSEEGQRSPPEFESSTPMCSADYINRCHGWLKLDKKNWPKNYHQCEWRGRPYSPEEADYRWAIVYDYVSSKVKEHDLNVTQANIDFFYLTGFEFAYCKPDNWRQGKLVDFGDLYSPFKRVVQVTPPRRWSAETWFKDKPVKPLTWWTSGAI